MMTDDPYRILGLKPGASDDEIKRAYKEMAKKYHPDLNGNSPEAAEMMKKVNEAYDILINHKNNYSSSSSSSSGYQNGNSYGYSQRGPFEWYTGFGGQGFNFGFDENDFARRYGMGPSLNRARALYNMREFGRCLQELSRIPAAERNAEWYFISSLAKRSTGSNAAAREDIETACRMDPSNQEYRRYRDYFNDRSSQYQSQRSFYGPTSSIVECCLSMLFFRFCCCII